MKRDGSFTTYDNNREWLESWYDDLSSIAKSAEQMGLQTRIEARDVDGWYMGSPWCPAKLHLVVTNKAGQSRNVHGSFDWECQTRKAEFKRFATT
jgi:hypothetical protein